jgi:hypothetical protein
VSSPFGGFIPDEITLSRQDAATVLLALDNATANADSVALRVMLERAAQIIVDKLLPDLPDL